MVRGGIDLVSLKSIDPDQEYDEHSEFWDYIYARDEGLCQLCGGKGEEQHHIKFKSQLGKNSPNNVILLCRDCHTNLVHGSQVQADTLRKHVIRNEKRFRSRLL